MREKEFPPLLANGFKDIAEEDLYTEFVKPFNQQDDYRDHLLNKFISYLKEFKSLNITAEIWIDGSFATMAPDPNDIDVVFYFNSNEVDNLVDEKKEKFQRLFISRKFMLNLYSVEVHYAQKGNEQDYQQWQRTFGTYYDNITPKGIFRMVYN